MKPRLLSILIPTVRLAAVTTATIATTATTALAAPTTAISKPNIIIFYVDDLGWQDTQLNNLDNPCPYDTPHIKKLAAAGMNFTQAYSPAPTCSASRAGIITGQHPAQVGMTTVDLGTIIKGKSSSLLVAPYLPAPLDLNLLTIADAMKANGYRTAHSGKWHVGLDASSYGFEVVNQARGTHRSIKDRTKDFATADDRKYPLSKEKYLPKSEKKPDGISYPYDEVTESALDFIDKNKAEPFFLNLCHWMVHWPVLTRNGELLEYYCDKLGQPFPPKPGTRKLEGQQNPYFAAMVTTVDWSLGRVVAHLEKTDDPRNPGKKLSETTYIFFSSDNGGAEIKGQEIISDNAPLKYGKKRSEEGGIRVPMVVTGPGIQHGTQFDGLVNQLDYFPTILKLTSAEIAPAHAKKLSGLDISPVLKGTAQDIMNAEGAKRDHLFWHFPHNGPDAMKSSVRSGDFKLYKRYAYNDYELYQLSKDGKRHDIEEANDIAKDPAFATVVESLGKMIEANLATTHAEGPYLNPAYEDKKTPSAALSTPEFVASSRLATLAVDAKSSAIKKAHLIYLAEETKEKSREKPQNKPNDAILPRMRTPAKISADGFSVSATLPANIHAFCFVVIDANGYMTYSEKVSAK